MFQIYDGREYFYQWDKDRKLIVMDGSIKEVHFCNRTEECSLRREVYKDGELHLVDVPNILLQDNYKINVYGYDGNYTKQSTTFTVKARSKPDDYIYTEEELKEWEELEARIKAIETGYATEDFVKAHTVVKPLPIKEKRIIKPVFRYYYVDLEELETGITYGLPIMPEEDNAHSTIIYYCIYCEDGTRKTIFSTGSHAGVTVNKTTTTITIKPIFPGCNEAYKVNISDKSTAEKLVVTEEHNLVYLGINNDNEYTPTGKYQPATKKYVDDTVASIDIPEVDLTGYATEEYVANYSHIKPLPVRERKFTKNANSTMTLLCYVDLEQLEDTIAYGMPEMTEEEREAEKECLENNKKVYFYVSYCIYCDDNTRKTVSMATERTFVVSKLANPTKKTISLITIMPTMNTEKIADITDKSTADNVIVTTKYNRDFLGINNTAEFTPETDYQPATKKYVDDKVASIDVPEVDLTGYATEEFVANYSHIKPAPIKEVEIKDGSLGSTAVMFIDLEQLEDNIAYGYPVVPEEIKQKEKDNLEAGKTLAVRVRYCIYCDDNTRKSVTLSLEPFRVISKSYNPTKKTISMLYIMPSGINTEYVVDITDKSTANNVIVTTKYNRDFLGINNTIEFTPTNDYQPATKKYVDDNAGGALSISETNVFGGNVDNDSVMGEYNFTFGDGALADATCATAFGKETIANSDFAFAINYQTEASGKASFAAGNNTVASGDNSAVFGAGMEVSGNNSFATGLDSVVNGKCSTAFGEGLTAEGDYQTVVGINNIADSDKLFIVGNGSLNDNEFNSNAFTVDSNGNAWFSGEVTIGADEKKLATLDDINNAIAALRAELAAT